MSLDPDNLDLWRQWRDAVATPAIDAAIGALYADLDSAVQARGPTCWSSGKCCHFDAYGHRLYVTGLEIAWVLRQVESVAEKTEASPAGALSLRLYARSPAACLPGMAEAGIPQGRRPETVSSLGRKPQDKPAPIVLSPGGTAHRTACAAPPGLKSSGDAPISGLTPRATHCDEPPALRKAPTDSAPVAGADSPDGCVFQVDRLCGIHAMRPMGCRIFFCQEGTQAWQQELYETFLTRLRGLHDEHGLPYRYMEWRAGLAEACGPLAPSPLGRGLG
ncbi:MAG: hypothetical protein WD042_03970 [Phycisphaeraceae bacterium]